MKFDVLYTTLLEKVSTHNNAYVFDFDQTIAETGAKIGVIKDGKLNKELTSQAFNTYVLKSGETFEFSQFKDGDKVLNKSKLLPYFYVMKNIYKRIKNMEHKVNRIYILTARSSDIQHAMFSLLERHNITIPIENIYTIGDQLKAGQTIAERKKEVLHELSDKYDEVTFFDDDERNIQLAKAIGPNIHARHIRLNGGITERKLDEISYKWIKPISYALDKASLLFKSKVQNSKLDFKDVCQTGLKRILAKIDIDVVLTELKRLITVIDVKCANVYFNTYVQNDEEAKALFVNEINDLILEFNDDIDKTNPAYTELESIVTFLRTNTAPVPVENITAITTIKPAARATTYEHNAKNKFDMVMHLLMKSKARWSDKFITICMLVFGLRIDFN